MQHNPNSLKRLVFEQYLYIMLCAPVRKVLSSKYRIAGKTKYSWFSNKLLRHFVGNIFVVAACTAGKGSKVASFVGKIFVVRPPTTKTTNILPHENYTLYGRLPT